VSGIDSFKCSETPFAPALGWRMGGIFVLIYSADAVDKEFLYFNLFEDHGLFAFGIEPVYFVILTRILCHFLHSLLSFHLTQKTKTFLLTLYGGEILTDLLYIMDL
jgi:hypothetical protein